MSKEIKKSEKVNKDPSLDGGQYDEYFNNRLSLPKALKEKLTSEGYDWRFINVREFRSRGNYHRTGWQPYNKLQAGEFGANSEGIIQRGDLLLAVRTKQISAAYKEQVNRRNAIQKTVNKRQAADLRRQLQGSGAKISEGYEDDN